MILMNECLVFIILNSLPLDYNPISIANGTHVKFILDYDYFFSANQQPYLSYASDSNIAQTVTISFTSATDSLAGVLFYSKTKHSINVLEVC